MTADEVMAATRTLYQKAMEPAFRAAEEKRIIAEALEAGRREGPKLPVIQDATNRIELRLGGLVDQLVSAEREACAKICLTLECASREDLAHAIRARGNVPVADYVTTPIPPRKKPTPPRSPK